MVPDTLARKLRYLRLEPFDTGTEAGRRDERHRLSALGAASNLLWRASTALAVILAVRLTLPWLGAERFGIWATFSSLVAMLSFLDLGVGNALVNRVAAARADPAAGAGSRRERDVVWAGLVTLGAFALISAAVLLVVSLALPWHRLFRLDDASALVPEARQAALVFAVLFGAQLLGSGSLKILNGQQRMHVANAVSAAFTLLSCLTLWWAARQRADVPLLLLATFGVQVLAGLLLWPLLLRRLGPRAQTPAAPAAASAIAGWRGEARALLGTGSLFLLLQIGTMIAWGADSLILASVSGASAVAVYAVGQRLFQFASQPWGVINAPLWAAYADAHARGERAFVRATLRRSLRWTFVGAATLAGLFALGGPWLVPLWTREALTVPMLVMLLFAAWAVFESVGNALAMYLNGCGIVRQQVVVVAGFVILALPAKIAGAAWGGIAGLLAASLLAYLLAVVLPYATIFRRDILRPLNGS